MFRSGYIAILGRPNVGKSTLLNAILGQKIAAVSPKPQTTRNRILGIRHLKEAQMIFLDTPGMHEPHKTLNEMMMEVSQQVLNDADILLFVTDPYDRQKEDPQIFEKLKSVQKPIVFFMNKIDQLDEEKLAVIKTSSKEQFLASAYLGGSALVGLGIDQLVQTLLEFLPEGPPYYDEEQVSDQNERFIVAEIIREKIMNLTRQELPYSTAVVIEAYREPRPDDKKKIVHIEASVIVEKDSQKAIVIGNKGEMIKKIGVAAREEIEKNLREKVFLELFVRVEKDWTKNPVKAKELAHFQ